MADHSDAVPSRPARAAASLLLSFEYNNNWRDASLLARTRIYQLRTAVLSLALALGAARWLPAEQAAALGAAAAATGLWWYLGPPASQPGPPRARRIYRKPHWDDEQHVMDAGWKVRQNQ